MEEEIKQVETISVPETPVQLPKKSNLSKIVPLFVLGLIILAGAVYAGITIGKKQNPPEIIPQAVEASPTPSETASWKTYRNEKYHYSLQYPSSAKIKVPPEISESLDIASTVHILLEENGDPFSIQILKNPLSLSSHDYVERASKEAEPLVAQGKLPPSFTLSSRDITINGVLAFEMVERGYDQDYKDVWLAHGKDIVVVSFPTGYSPGDPKAAEHYDIFSEILHTFKFLE